MKAKDTTLTAKPKAGLRQWITKNWHPAKVEAPKVDPALPVLNEVQRSAEVLRYSVLQTEYWLSPSGCLREWLRLNLMVALLIGTPALVVVPIVTYLLTEFVTWTALLIQMAKNFVIFPIAAIILTALLSGAVCILRLLSR